MADSTNMEDDLGKTMKNLTQQVEALHGGWDQLTKSNTVLTSRMESLDRNVNMITRTLARMETKLFHDTATVNQVGIPPDNENQDVNTQEEINEEHVPMNQEQDAVVEQDADLEQDAVVEQDADLEQDVVPFTQINGFCSKGCQDDFVGSMLLSESNGLHFSVPRTSDQNVFKIHPWFLGDFFDQSFLEGETSRAWIFAHSNIPSCITSRMSTNHRWYVDEHYLVRKHGVDISLRHFYITYMKEDHDHGGQKCGCPHETYAMICPGWVLSQYTFEDTTLFCLTYKLEKNALRPKPIRKKTTRAVYEGRQEYFELPKKKVNSKSNLCAAKASGTA